MVIVHVTDKFSDTVRIATPGEPVEARVEVRFTGLPISGGVAVGRICLFNEERHNDMPMYRVAPDARMEERVRLEEAIAAVAAELAQLAHKVEAKVGGAQAAIFVAQKMMVEDPVLLDEMHAFLDETSLNAEAIISMSLDQHELALARMEDEYLRERAADIGEIKHRLLDALGETRPMFRCEGQPFCQRGRNRIVVAEELTPRMTMALDTEHTLGFVTERGGTGSHAAILARALGIPAVSGIKDIHNLVACGAELLLDGNTGEVVVWPSKATIESCPECRRGGAGGMDIVEPVEGIRVMGNIGSAAEIDHAIEACAEGIGLYRTEFPMLAAGRITTEDEQYEDYAAVVKAMAGQPVYFRLLDLGGDKAAAFLDIPPEGNPHLGLRGARLLLAYPEILETQARALVRASAHGPVHVLYPMVVSPDQFRGLREIFDRAVSGMPTVDVRHGVMFEVPSACLAAEELLAMADFASVGTNDLVQYLFAVDRDNELVAHDYNPDQPVFWETLRRLASAAAGAGRPISICGEIAGEPRYVRKLVELGYTIVSVAPRRIAETRRAILDARAGR